MSGKVGSQSVRKRIIFLVLLLVIPLVLLGIAGTLYYQNVIKQNIENDNLGSAKTIAAMTPEYMNASELYLKSIADRPLVVKAMEDNDTTFLRTMADYTDNTTRIRGVYFTDGKGIIIVSTPDYASSSGSDASQQPFVRYALQSGEPVIGDAIPGSGGMPVVPIGVPVLGENGTVLGTLVGNVDLGEFSKVILNATESNRQYVYMVNRTGHVMVHNNPVYMQNMRDFSSVPAVQLVMKGESGILENYNPIENMTRLAAYAPVGPLGWSVVVAVPLDVAYKPVWDATWMAMGIIGAFTIIIIGLGLYVGNGISSPIIGLSQVMKNVDETGEYRQHLPIARKDEIGELARSFDDMVIAIQHENRERMQAEETLRKSEEKYRELVENANSIIIRWDADGRMLFFNEFAEQFFGYHKDEVIGKDVTVLIPATDTAGRDLRAMVEDIKRYPERYVNNLNENILKNGERRWVMWTNKAVRDDLGNVKEILAVGNDVTELRHAEEAREQLLAELKARTAELQDVNEEVEVKNEELAAQSEEMECANEELKTHNEELQSVSKSLRETHDYLENLINYANAPIIVWDPAFTITRFNKAFERLSGYTAKEVIGQNLGLLFPQESKDGSLDLIKKTLAGEQWESVEIPILHKYGGVHIALWNSANVYDDEHGLVATIAQGQDITQRKKAEKDLEDAKAQAELYLDLMGHDISNMHQIMMMQLELAADVLKMEGKLEGNDKELIDSSVRTLDKAARLINNVRKLQKHQSGEFSLEPVDLSLTLKEVLKDYANLPGKEIEVKFNPDGRRMVQANPLLKDVFSNIVDNAVKHSSDSLALAINISKISRNGSDFYRVSIEDNGNGIPDDKKDEVFHRFRRGQTKAKGTGLGLYIVKTLVEGFGGYVEIQNRVLDDYRQGTRFLVYLPAAEGGDAGIE